MDEQIPCKCGGQAELSRDGIMTRIRCGSCGACLTVFGTKIPIVEMWNLGIRGEIDDIDY